MGIFYGQIKGMLKKMSDSIGGACVLDNVSGASGMVARKKGG